MTRFKKPAVKKRLAKKLGQTKWAPFWTVPKIFGKNRRVHPGRQTKTKRSWRRGSSIKP
jgi:ribosomal protein L39E